MTPEHRTGSVDRTGWPEGPWDGEEDRYDFRTEAGYPGLIVRNDIGALCGYVGVANGHPCYGKDYSRVDVDVHGGLTYASKCRGRICHAPELGESDDVFWLGFDCAHAGDVAPGMYRVRLEPSLVASLGVYRDVTYVRMQCEDLAAQLAAMGR